MPNLASRLVLDHRLAWTEYDAGCYMREHTHNFGTITLFLGGAATEYVPGTGSHTIAPMQVVFKPPGVPHVLDVQSTGLASLQLRPPSAWHRQFYSMGILSGYHWDRSWAAATDFLSMSLALAVGDLADAERAAVALASHRPTEPGPLAAEICDEIERSYQSGVSSSWLADQRRVHRSSLARAVRREIGCGPKELFARRRLVAAVEQLRCPRGSLAAVARRCGYSDQSHMTREFTCRLGRSPGRVRLALTG